MGTARQRPAHDDERARFLDLKCEVFGTLSRADEERRFDWQFRTNPAAGRLPFAVLHEEGDELLGAYAFVPSRVKISNREGLAAAGIDLAVAARARGRGIARPLTAVHWREGFCDFPYATGLNSASRHLFTAHGGTLLGGELENTVRGWFRAAHPDPAIPGEVRRTTLHSSAATTPPIGDFEDELWRRLAPGLELSLVKDASYLRWRYEQFPFAPCTLRRVASRSGEPAALGVLQFDLENRRAYLLELLAVPGEEAALLGLLEDCVEQVRADVRGIDAVFVSTRDAVLDALLDRAGWQSVPGPTPTFVGKLHGADRAVGVERWRTSLGDGDQLFQVGA